VQGESHIVGIARHPVGRQAQALQQVDLAQTG
jgi:hypothetical protein